MHIGERFIDSIKVLLDDRFTAFTVGLLNAGLDVSNGFFLGKNAADGKETGLHDGIDPVHPDRCGVATS